MTHRIKPGGRYKLDPSGPTYENTLPHDIIIVDRQPIHVGRRVADGPFDLFKPRESSFSKPRVFFDIETHPFDTVFMNGVYGKMGVRPSEAGRRMPTFCNATLEPWPSPKKESPFPAFVAPERPAEPEAPKPEPDTPAVAALKALLADRQREVGKRKADVGFEKENVADCAEALVEAERALATSKQDLAHAETVLAAATAEVDAIVSDIEKLGGKVEP